MRRSVLLVISVYLVSALATPAHAYLDPGSGSMLVQLLLGGLAGVALFLKLFWHDLLARLGLRRDTTEQKVDAETSRDAHSRPADL